MPEDDLIRRYQSALAPTAPAIDQQALWFEAGRASVTRRGPARWLQAYSIVATATAASLAGVIALEAPPTAPEAQQVAAAPIPNFEDELTERMPEAAAPESALEPLVERPEPATPPAWLAWLVPDRPAPADSYVALRDRVLREGMLPAPRVYEASLRSGPPIDWTTPERDLTARGLLEELLPPTGQAPPPPIDEPAGDQPEASHPTNNRGGLA